MGRPVVWRPAPRWGWSRRGKRRRRRSHLRRGRPRFHDRGSERSVWGLLMGLFSGVRIVCSRIRPHTNFVNRCLQEKGYEVTGWR